MTVRPYASSDFAAVCRIYADARRAELQFEGGSFDIVPLDRDPVLRGAFEESTVFVFDNEGVVGFAALHATQLRALFVQGDARGAGVGTALLRRILAHAPELGLNVARSNARARRFYEKHGFVVTGTVEKQYGGRQVAYVTMASRRVSPGIADGGGTGQ